MDRVNNSINNCDTIDEEMQSTDKGTKHNLSKNK